MKNNILEWHFTISGLEGTDYQNGIYHGRVILDKKYPYIAPDIYLLTPNGRFKPNQKICLSATKFHQNKWQPRIKIKDILYGLKYFMNVNQSKVETMGVGAMVTSPEERRFLAKRSLGWKCEACGYCFEDVKHKFDLKEEKESFVKVSVDMDTKDYEENKHKKKIRENQKNIKKEKDKTRVNDQTKVIDEIDKRVLQENILQKEENQTQHKLQKKETNHKTEMIQNMMSSTISDDYFSYVNLQNQLKHIDQTSDIDLILKEIKEMKLVSMSVKYKDHPSLASKIKKPSKISIRKRLKSWIENLLFAVLLIVIYYSLLQLLYNFGTESLSETNVTLPIFSNPESEEIN